MEHHKKIHRYNQWLTLVLVFTVLLPVIAKWEPSYAYKNNGGVSLPTINLSETRTDGGPLEDSDYDGIANKDDPNPGSNEFSGMLVRANNHRSSKVSYTMDYRAFFQDNEIYNEKLCVTSSLYASLIYKGIEFKAQDGDDTYDIDILMKYHGLSDIKRYKLSKDHYDNHLSEAIIGHRKVTYKGKTREILVVVIRGTNASVEEWSSNFDVGDTSNYKEGTDWQIKENHTGFDTAASRILRYLNTYISNYLDPSTETVIWLTGHSRGAAISNILGARLEDSNYDTYTYTFAAPNTTTAATAEEYQSIFNIMNSDDFIPYLPLASWGFTKYGQSVSISVAEHYEKEWEALVGTKNKFGIVDYNPDTLGMKRTLEVLGEVAANRDACYQYTCKCHGDGSDASITISKWGLTKGCRDDMIAWIPTNALPYCKITRYEGSWLGGWNFDCCQTPMYWMQLLAARISGEIGDLRFVFTLPVADRYKNAKRRLIASANDGIKDAHYPETYYLLAKHITQEDFK